MIIAIGYETNILRILLIKYWQIKSLAKMKASLYQFPVRNDNRHLGAFLGEFATNSYVHGAHFHSALWGPYTDVEKNMAAIIVQEHENAEVTFPEYARIAREEGFEDIALAFEAMARVDADQGQKLSDILEKLKSDSIFNKEDEQDWYCTRCGNVQHGASAPETCPLCNAQKRYFEIKGANFATF